MAGENINSAADTAEDSNDPRQRSTIGFPYNNLGDAIAVAQAIHSNVGTGDCDDAQLSAWMNLSPKSSGFRGQVSASRMFGVVETSGGRHRLSQLGRMIVDPSRERDARARAFLNVPLYNAIFERYNGSVLPPAAALEREIIGLGVAEKQTSRARQVFERSADQGGFFEHGRNRLVRPGVATHAEGETPKTETIREEPPKRNGSGSGGGDIGELHPFVQGLLKTLPAPETEWPAAARIKWLQTAANIFDLIYSGDGGGIVVTSARAERSPRPHDHD
jgi:hypothetical protein